MDSVRKGQRGPYKQWKYTGGDIPRSTRHRRQSLLRSPNGVRPTIKEKPLKRLQRHRKTRIHSKVASSKCSERESSVDSDIALCQNNDNIPSSSFELCPSSSCQPKLLTTLDNVSPDILVSPVNHFSPNSMGLCENEESSSLNSDPCFTNAVGSQHGADSENGQDFNFCHIDDESDNDDNEACDEENVDEDSFVLHLSLDDSVVDGPEVSANPTPPVDPEDSDDSDEVLDKAPDLHLTVNEKIKLLLLLATKKRHKLTYVASEDILDLAGVFSPDDEIPSVISKHIMKSAIEKYSFKLELHHMCPSCGKYVGIVTAKTFQCTNCNRVTHVLENKRSGTTFLYLPLREQLRELLESLPDHTLIDPKDRTKINMHNYEDIFDGAAFKLIVSEGTITLNFFIDGVQVNTTCKQSAWPVLVTVNELPLMLRRKHVMMASLWLSKKKPVCNEYLIPYVAELSDLARTGVSYRRSNGVLSTLKVKACCCISDSIARPMIRNSKQFNGKFGCGFCYHPGVKMSKGRGSTGSYTTRDNIYRDRTHQEVMDLAVRAELQGKPLRGIKGKSILAELPDFDVVRFIDVDSFHAVVNVVKRFCSLWFDSPPKNSPVPAYKIHNKLAQVDKRLLSIKPTHEVSRAPRSLTEHSDYRGHEWFHFILFYSVPILKNILPQKYLSHWSLFVISIAMLMQNSASRSEVAYTERYLNEFVSGIDDLYGSVNVTFNCHLLLHLARSVRDFAQLFTHSAFIYESFNNEIKEAVHSSNGIAQQIVKAMQLIVAVMNMEKELRVDMSERQRDYLDKVNQRGKRLAPPHLCLDSVSLLGKPNLDSLSQDLRVALTRAGVTCTDKTKGAFYERFQINNEVFHASTYSRVSKRNNSVVLLESGQVFLIECVVVIASECFIAGYYYEEQRNKKLCNVTLPHVRILKDSPEGTLRCVQPSDIGNKLIG